jgi:hypothetical protein
MDPGQGKQCQSFVLLSVDAKLRVFDSSFDISSGTSNQYCKVYSKSSNRLMVEFVLSSYKILKIE